MATVESREPSAARTPSGIVIASMWTLSPISSPSRSTVSRSGMASTEQATSMVWRMMLRMPPRRNPGAPSWLTNPTGTLTVTRAPAPTRMKSTCMAASLIGWC